MDVGYGEACAVLVVFGEAPASAEPGEGTLDDPTLGQDLETGGLVGA
jgi:hypothetical protein